MEYVIRAKINNSSYNTTNGYKIIPPNIYIKKHINTFYILFKLLLCIYILLS